MTKTAAEKLRTLNPEAILFDNRLDSAILGVGYSTSRPPVAIYSKKAIYETLQAIGISTADVDDYYRWHFESLNAGENAPVIFDDTATEDK